MLMDITDLRKFYLSPLGTASIDSIANAITVLWGNSGNDLILGLGFTTPWLDRFGPDSEGALNFTPATQGALRWPIGKPSNTAMVFEEELPLEDSCIDRVIVAHLLEHSANPQETLREIWRVLTPNGKIFVIAPNRRGLWSRFEHTPFGAGRPFSRGQLNRLLQSAFFTPVVWSDALHFPPGKINQNRWFYGKVEVFGRRFWPLFSGVILVEANKKLYQGITAPERQSHQISIPVLVPQGASKKRYFPNKNK